MKITITTGDLSFDYEAATGQEAVQMFFDDVVAGKIEIAELGSIGEWNDGKESYPFRITPALYRCGLITHSQMCNLFKLCELYFTSSEIAGMVIADSWMVRQGGNIPEESGTIQ